MGNSINICPTEYYKTLQCGVGIEMDRRRIVDGFALSTATCGFYIIKNGVKCGVTSGHAVSKYFDLLDTNTINQPGEYLGGKNYPMGTVLDYKQDNLRDVALIGLDLQNRGVVNQIPYPNNSIYQLLPVTPFTTENAEDVYLGLAKGKTVFKFGAKTGSTLHAPCSACILTLNPGFTRGTITNINQTFTDKSGFTRTNYYGISPSGFPVFASAGDSGSAIIDEASNKVIGILTLGFANYIYALPIVNQISVWSNIAPLVVEEETEALEIVHTEEQIRRSQRLQEVKKVVQQKRDLFVKIVGVVAVTACFRVKSGEITDDPAFVVWVEEKLSEDTLCNMGREILPKFVDSEFGRIIVDVQVVGQGELL